MTLRDWKVAVVVALMLVGCAPAPAITPVDWIQTISDTQRAFFALGFAEGRLAEVKHLDTNNTPCERFHDGRNGINPDACSDWVEQRP